MHCGRGGLSAEGTCCCSPVSGWAPGWKWGWCNGSDGERQSTWYQQPLQKCFEAPSRSLPGQLGLCRGVDSCEEEWAKVVVWEVWQIREDEEFLQMFLKGAISLFKAQEEKRWTVNDNNHRQGNGANAKLMCIYMCVCALFYILGLIWPTVFLHWYIIKKV